jgi:hypothetical protein
MRLLALVCVHWTKEVEMSVLRLALTTAAMVVTAALLSALTPELATMTGALAAPQRTADTVGPDVLVQAAAGLLAWAVWGWGALGLALTAVAALPGVVGNAADLVLHVVLPAGARRGAALVLGLGIGVGAPLLVLTSPLAVSSAAASAPAADVPVAAGGVPDWAAPATAPTGGPVPDRAADPVPEWSRAAAAGTHVVVRGDSLWHIAAASLRAQKGVEPTDADVAVAVQAWWTANSEVIGPDPDLLLPGQVLRAPGPPP